MMRALAVSSPNAVARRVTAGALVMIGLTAGLGLARLPLLWAGVGLVMAVLFALALIEPLVGVGVTLLFATFKPVTDYFLPALPLDIGQLALIYTLAVWLVRQAIRRDLRVPSSPFNLPLLLFIGVGGLSLLNALSLGYGLKELIKWLQILGMMWLIQLEAGQRRWPVVIGFVLAAGLIQAAIGIWQFGLRGDGPEHFLILNDRFYRAYGTFEQPNPYGGFLGLTLPIALALALHSLLQLGAYFSRPSRAGAQQVNLLNQAETAPARKSRLKLFAQAAAITGLALALGMGLIASWSRGAWLGAGAAGLMALAAWPRRGWLGIGLLLAALVIGGFSFSAGLLPASITARLTDFTSEITANFDARGVDITSENYAVTERFAHWQAAQDMARYHPWLGVGLGNYEPVYPGYQLINWPYPLGHAHNIYLNMLAETGIIGLLAYLGLWAVVFAVTWRATRALSGWRRAVAIGLLGAWTHLAVHHLVDNLYVANIHLHIGALLGVLALLHQEERRLPIE